MFWGASRLINPHWQRYKSHHGQTNQAADCDGHAIEWPELDEHIGMEGLLAGRSSGEREALLQRWLAGRTVRSTHDGCVAPAAFAKVL